MRGIVMEIQTCGKPIDSLLEKVLCMNILSSNYFKELYRFKTYHEVIDEIYKQDDHVELWMTGNCRGPSTAFFLLYKFFTMKPTVKQMHGLLKHPDSPYIRAELRRKENAIARVNGIANFLVLLNQGFGFDFKPYVHPIYNAILSRLTNQDQD
ncbi:pre-mRNA splicing factor SR-like 1 [Gossypium arboreum]|nr:pre-mRNA splicing factor SR-like 1 [Gossypium arboreum]